MKRNALKSLGILAVLGVAATEPARAVLTVDSGAYSYSQDFDSLATSGTANAWANDSTIAGWSLFRQPAPGTALTAYRAESGAGNAGSIYSYGASSSNERALGGLGSGGSYWGSPASGNVAGWIAVAFRNTSGAALSSFTVGFNGEQWRDGGLTSGTTTPTAQSMVMEYGFGSTFASVSTWTAPHGSFDWSSPVYVNTTSGAAVDGNTAGLVANRGGTQNVAWNNDDTLWIRWVERNDANNDHGLAIDNFTFSATGEITVVPEPATTWAAVSGLVMLGCGYIARRKRQG